MNNNNITLQDVADAYLNHIAVTRPSKWRYSHPVTKKSCIAYLRFCEHRGQAKKRNIPFTFTFAEWEWAWLSSGRWAQRGNRKGQFQMARRGPDQGPYAPWNVDIKTREQNLAEADFSQAWPQERRAEMKAMHEGKPKSKLTRARMSAASVKRGAKPPSRYKEVEVLGVRYDSMAEAAQALGIRVPALRKRIQNGWPGHKYV